MLEIAKTVGNTYIALLVISLATMIIHAWSHLDLAKAERQLLSSSNT